MDSRPPLQKLRVRLLKSHVRSMEDALDTEDRATPKMYALKRGLGFSGGLFISTPKQSVPNWFEFVQEGADEDIRQLTNKSNSAVLIIHRKENFFVFTFGHGRHLIKPSALVHDFGIKAALNGLRHDSIRSTDSFIVEEQTLHKRTQASRSSGIGTFGLDIGRDILRAVTGDPRADAPKMITSISGMRETLAVSAHVEFPGLGDLCDDLLGLYRKRVYRENFSWVDDVRHIQDPDKINDLDTLLSQR